MKRKMKTSAIVHCSLLIVTFASPAAVPLSWQVDVTRVAPVTFDAYHGETLALEAVLKDASRPLDLTGKTARLYWQTNGMESVYWATNAVVERITDDGRAGRATLPGVVGASVPLASTNWCVRATFTGAMDPGAASVRGFLGIAGENYRASFVIRFRPSPGYVPGVIDYPPKTLDLAHTVVVNPPWPTQADYAATTTVMRAELKDYIDAQIEGAELVTPQVVTNVVESKIAAIPRDGVSTGAVNFVIGEAVRTNWLCTVAAAAAMTNDVLAKASNAATTKANAAKEAAIAAAVAMTNDVLAKASNYAQEKANAAKETAIEEAQEMFLAVDGKAADAEHADEADNADWAESAGSVAWNVISGKPTTLTGYGIEENWPTLTTFHAATNQIWNVVGAANAMLETAIGGN